MIGMGNLSLMVILLRAENQGHMCHVNVPILGHYNITECYAYQSSQIGVTESSGDIEGFYWARLASFIIRIHSAQAWLWFRCIPTISVILSYYGSYLN
jgi:hypothetical protein